MEFSTPSVWTLLAVAISVLALAITYFNFRRKSSIDLRGYCQWVSSSVYADEPYVSSILLENLKDRAVTIFKVYVRIGHNYYIEVEDFQEKPMVLRAFESWHKEYGPIEFYSVSSKRLSISGLYKDSRAKPRLVLSTGDGKYVVSKRPKYWSPVADFFSNHMTAAIRPVLTIYKDIYIGGRTKYVVDFINKAGKAEVICIFERDYEVMRFAKFRLTKESLESADSLTAFLALQVELGLLSCQSYEVIDIVAWRNDARKHYGDETIQAEYVNFWTYKLWGRTATLIADYQLKQQNKRIKSMSARSREANSSRTDSR